MIKLTDIRQWSMQSTSSLRRLDAARTADVTGAKRRIINAIKRIAAIQQIIEISNIKLSRILII